MNVSLHRSPYARSRYHGELVIHLNPSRSLNCKRNSRHTTDCAVDIYLQLMGRLNGERETEEEKRMETYHNVINRES